MKNVNNGVSGKMILDSVTNEGIRLSTMHLRYPRMVHSELMTHRVFSRNGRSSRAVPVATLLKESIYTPHFMKNEPGMVATEELDETTLLKAQVIWEQLASATKDAVAALHNLGVHKQWANRPLEWFGYIDVLISSTDWANFLALRDESGAQPEIDSVGKLVRNLLEEGKPETLNPGEWHLPYIELEDFVTVRNHITGNGTLRVVPTNEQVLDLLRKISTARCARLSIKPYDGDGSIEKELLRYERLVVSRPVHASPAEHIATPDTVIPRMTQDIGAIGWSNKEEHGNFFGWRQYRKMIPHNTILDR